MGEVAALIIDEDPVNAGLATPVRLPLDALAKVTHGFFERKKFDGDTMRDLKWQRRKLLRAFKKMPDGPVTRAALEAALITGED